MHLLTHHLATLCLLKYGIGPLGVHFISCPEKYSQPYCRVLRDCNVRHVSSRGCRDGETSLDGKGRSQLLHALQTAPPRPGIALQTVDGRGHGLSVRLRVILYLSSGVEVTDAVLAGVRDDAVPAKGEDHVRV